MTGSGGFFFRKTVGQVSVPTWRTWLLVWLLPLLTLGAALLWAVSAAIWLSNAVETTGTVTRVEALAQQDGPTLYAPEFSYIRGDGEAATGSLALAAADFNFEIGSTHRVLYDPANKGALRLPGFAFNYIGPLVVAMIGAMFALISLVLWVWVKAIARKRDQQETSP